MPFIKSPASPINALVADRRPRGRPRKTVDERDDGNRRHALLQSAALLFRQNGYDATTTRQIATAAGMQSGSPFYHFKTKDALLYAVMEEGMRTAQSRQLLQVQQTSFQSVSAQNKVLGAIPVGAAHPSHGPRLQMTRQRTNAATAKSSVIDISTCA